MTNDEKGPDPSSGPPDVATRAYDAFNRVYDPLKKALDVAASLGLLIAALAFKSVPPHVSAVFTLIAGALFALFIWRTRRHWLTTFQPAAALAAATLVMVIAVAYVGCNVYPLYRAWRGYHVRPAAKGELLILLTDFKKMGNRAFNVTDRVQRVLNDQLKSEHQTTRIESIPIQVNTPQEARTLGERHRAVLVFWGYYDSAAIHSTITITAPTESPFGKSSVDLSQVRADPGQFNIYVDRTLPKQILYLTATTLGVAYYQQRDYKRARSMLDIATESVEGKPEGLSYVYYYRGRILQTEGQRAAALNDYTKAIEADRQNKFALNDRGLLYFGGESSDPNTYDLAFADFAAAIDVDANFAPPYNNRGNVYQVRGQYDLALADYDKALALNPRLARTYNNIAALYTSDKKNDSDKLLENLNRAVALAPTDGEIYVNRCYAHRIRGELDLGLKDCNRAVELGAADPNVYYNRGLIYRQQGLKPKAIEDLERHLALKPQTTDRTQIEQWLSELRSR